MKKWQGVLEKNEFILNDLRYSIFSKTNMSNILSKGACVTLEAPQDIYGFFCLLGLCSKYFSCKLSITS